MNKYYLRFNPDSKDYPEEPAWIIESVLQGKIIDQCKAFNVVVDTTSCTERSSDTANFPNWWNIACNGYLTIDSEGNAIISSQPPVSSGDI
jgi:hypothetical protein